MRKAINDYTGLILERNIMTPDKRRGLWQTCRTLSLFVLLYLAASVAFIRLAPTLPIDNLDSDWALGMNEAVSKGLILGKDLIFTLGPYASLYSAQYNPATDTQMLAGGALLAAAFAAALLCLAQGGRVMACIGFALFLPFTLPLNPIFPLRDAEFLSFPLLMLLLTYRASLPKDDSAHIVVNFPLILAVLLLCLVLALLPLIKGTFAAASLIGIAGGCVLLTLGGMAGLAIIAAIIYVFAIPVFWIWAHQPLAALPHFLVSMRPIIGGYTSAMSIHGPFWQIFIYLGCCLVFAVAHGASLARRGAAGLILAAATALVLFLCFKESFVREDAHALVGASMLGIAGWVGMLLGSREKPARLALISGMAGWLFITLHFGTPRAPYLSALRGAEIRLLSPAKLQRDYAANLADIRMHAPLPAMSGPTDIYSYGQAALLAAGLDWDPRPVLQSYSAYTPELLRADAAHLTGPAAPETIIFAVQPIDNRFPSLDDGASWPLLLTRYHFTGYANNAAILMRDPTPAGLVFTPILAGRFNLGSIVALPPDQGMVWAQISVRLTRAGDLLAAFFKPPELWLTYNLPDGESKTYRFIPGESETGFLLAPLVRNARDFVALQPSQPALNDPLFPASIQLHTASGTSFFWQAQYDLRLSYMKIIR